MARYKFIRGVFIAGVPFYQGTVVEAEKIPPHLIPEYLSMGIIAEVKLSDLVAQAEPVKNNAVAKSKKKR